MFRTNGRWWLAGAVLTLVLWATYSNHFQNSFHFDDFHTVTGNPFIRDIHNIPRFFRDSTIFSTLPDHATWRPIVSMSLAVDYWLGKGRQGASADGAAPFYFHLSTFFWFVVQVMLMGLLFGRVMDAADPHPSNRWTALAAAACYGLHPVSAETVNYVIQRADLYCTLGVVAGLYWFAAKPSQRRWGWYLLPMLAACLSKPAALVFPLILLAYVFLFEVDADPRQWRAALRATLPAALVALAAAGLNAWMTPATYLGGASSRSLYWLTQPWVALHYFKSFFLPTELSADSDWGYVSDALSTEAVTGYLFVAGLLVAVGRTWRSREARPVAFGILWFLLTLLPTALMPLAEVTNDHRMFFPFVGLALAVFWSVRLVLFRSTQGLTTNGHLVRGSLLLLLIVLAASASATRTRNEVWRSEESLWRDVALKSPKNGRGLMNYGLVFMSRGEYATALSYFDRALAFTPGYWALEVNLGLAQAGLNSDGESERHFVRALQLAPGVADPYFYYGRWLRSRGRSAEAAARLEIALQINRLHFDARHVLLEVYASLGNGPALERLAQDTLKLAPDDEPARRFLATGQTLGQPGAMPEQAAAAGATPESYLNLSLHEYQAGRFEGSIAAAKKAIELRANYAEAYNNISAAYNSMGRYDEGIQAALQAIRIKPDYELARNNMLWAISAKKQAGAPR